MATRGSGVSLARVGRMQHAGYPANHLRWMLYNHTGAAPAAVDTLYLYWFPIYSRLLVTLLRTRCTSGGAGSAVKFGIWRGDSSTGRPFGVPVIGQNTGLATTTGSTWQDLVVSSVALDVGGIWFGSKFTGTLPTMVAQTSTGQGAGLVSFPSSDLPTTPQGNFSVAAPYADDIMAMNLTGAALLPTGGSVPGFVLGWA